MITVALISPNQNLYSETFIQAHKTRLTGNIKYLYNGALPADSEDQQLHVHYSILNRLRRKVNKLFFPSLMYFHERALVKYFNRNNVKIVFCEYGITAVEMMKICAKIKLPLIVHFHGLDAYLNEIINKNRLSYKQLFKQAYAVIAVSSHMKQQLEILGCNTDKIIVNPCGPSEEFFKLQPDYSSNYFLAIGRFVEKKAPQNTIQAFSKVVKKYPAAKLRMVGDGPLLDNCQQLAKDLNIQDNLEFLGIKTPVEIQDLYTTSFAFVQHSVTAVNGDSEGTPVAVLEASAGALPVILTYHTGISEVVVHEQTGLLCREHDIETMANNMCRIFSDRELAHKLGTNGRERIKKHYTLEKHIDILNDIIARASAT